MRSNFCLFKIKIKFIFIYILCLHLKSFFSRTQLFVKSKQKFKNFASLLDCTWVKIEERVFDNQIIVFFLLRFCFLLFNFKFLMIKKSKQNNEIKKNFQCQWALIELFRFFSYKKFRWHTFASTQSKCFDWKKMFWLTFCI